MAMLITTKCPHCQTKFDIPAAQFEDSTAKGRCSHCHKTFFINDHIVHAADKAKITAATDASVNTTSKPQAATQAASAPQKPQPSGQSAKQAASDSKKDDDLIYDDMAVEEDDDLGDIGDALIYDDMDIDTSRNAASALQELDLDALFDENFKETQDTNTARTAPSLAKPSAHPSATNISSNKANDIGARADSNKRQHADDNAWLEGLLQEKEQDTHQTSSSNDDTDLSELLSQMGVEADTTARPSKAPVIQRDAPSKPLPIASILWAVGCIVLALLLFAQYLIFNADNIIKNPEKASTLQSICALASCSLPSANLQQLTIDAAMHRPSQVKDPAFFSDIGADIVNQSENGQLMPSLLIQVYGANNILLGDFLAQPDDYLLSPQNQMAGSSTLPVLFTVPIENQHITQVAIQPLY